MPDELNGDIHERLEKAVLEVFSSSDFHRASIRDIANKAGVSFTTIYKHYGSKERLVFAFVDIWMGKLITCRELRISKKNYVKFSGCSSITTSVTKDLAE